MSENFLKRLLLPAFGLALISTPVLAAETASGVLTTSSGANAGTVLVTETPNGVLLNIDAKNLTPGWHGIHFHEKGFCEGPKFTSAGGHIHTQTPVVHGFQHANENDAGDLPNIFVGTDGTAKVELYSSFVSLKPSSEHRPALISPSGSSVVIHANPDDYTSQPIGGAGDRVACAVLKSN